jgi:c-di-GMP-binding flagellar brake protein YcgR
MPRLEVSSKPRILALLNRLATAREPIGVGPVGDVQLYSSAIVEVNEASNKFILPTIKNEPGHARILQSGKLRVCAYLDGVRIQFITALRTGPDVEEAFGVYQAVLPRYLLYYQQREKERIRLENQQVEISGIAPDSAFLTGYAVDISEAGIGLDIHRYDGLSQGDVLSEVRLVLPGARDVFRCTMEVRSLKISGDSRMNLGCRFVDLDDAHRARVKQALDLLNQDRLEPIG